MTKSNVDIVVTVKEALEAHILKQPRNLILQRPSGLNIVRISSPEGSVIEVSLKDLITATAALKADEE